MPENFTGRRVTVMGLGTFGGGVAAARFFYEQGAVVTVTDLRSRAELAESLASLRDLPELRFRLGGHEQRDFIDADLLVVSPAVKPGNALVDAARESGTPVTSELRLFWERCPARIIGVTGSNGKSTTATLIHDVLKADGRRVWLGGNIGRSLLPQLDAIDPDDWVVLELSSFQLTDLDSQRLSPHVAVVTNFAPNHLDWHGSLQNYRAAKQAILRWQCSTDFAVRHASGPDSEWPTKAQALFCRCSDGPGMIRRASVAGPDGARWADRQEVTIEFARCPQLTSPHQQSNAALASATGLALGAAPEAIVAAMESYSGIPHRFQILGDFQARRFINDSASTTPESTIAALEALESPPVLIVGGSEKGCLLEPLAESIAARASAAVMIGPVQGRLAKVVDSVLVASKTSSSRMPLQAVRRCDSLTAAFEAALECSSPGSTVLFSPGFSSGAMFRNYADRGLEFVDLVRNNVTT